MQYDRKTRCRLDDETREYRVKTAPSRGADLFLELLDLLSSQLLSIEDGRKMIRR